MQLLISLYQQVIRGRNPDAKGTLASLATHLQACCSASSNGRNSLHRSTASDMLGSISEFGLDSSLLRLTWTGK